MDKGVLYAFWIKVNTHAYAEYMSKCELYDPEVLGT
jgi:hypothetical protein